MSGIPELERLRFFPGELLTAADLTALDDNNNQLRWLHNRTLHPWGIGFGLDVMGNRGDTVVSINPGYANDSLGREILLASAISLPIPAVPGGPGNTAATYYVVANYVPDAQEPAELQRGATACTSGGSVRLSNAPAIIWKTAAQLNPGIDVILGQVGIKNCVLAAPVATAVRRYAAPQTNFALTAGQVFAGDLHWTAWQEAGTAIGLRATITTSTARFQSTPVYFVQIIGSRTLASPLLVVADFVSIAAATAASFTLQVAFPAMPGGLNPPSIRNPIEGPELLARLGWHVIWMGVEG
jgi:hypothetical protein